MTDRGRAPKSRTFYTLDMNFINDIGCRQDVDSITDAIAIVESFKGELKNWSLEKVVVTDVKEDVLLLMSKRDGMNQ